ncbi:MAG: site-specific integrase [Myxococcota bacterium]
MLDGEAFSQTFDAEQDAWDWLAAMRELGTQARKAPETLATFGAKWLDRRELSGGVRHVKKERSVWRHHVLKSEISTMPIKAIRRKHVAAFVSAMQEREAVSPIKTREGVRYRPLGRTVGRQTVVHALRLVRTCLDAAADQGLRESNPATGVRVPRGQPAAPVWTFLTEEEIASVLTVEFPRNDLRRRAVYATAIFTGLRMSELWHLRWERVRLEGTRPLVEVRAPIKSARAVRDVPLLPPAIKALREWRDRGGIRRATGLVWPREDGGVHDDTFTDGWFDHPYRKDGKLRARPGACTRAGIERDVRFHDLRHTFCSHLAQGSWGRVWTMREICDVAGHSSISVTMRYAHLSPGGVHAAAAQMRAVWEEG